ncbi:hypothetical protein COCMIDRAFT_8904 [Bipolaris oryzae ATCC 44560]|uniref:Uncharacterized protein n=1 Tax=Bipolaris oryzae ATCC 44560 TaxID=930090 RepID=W6ZCA2_COCMI|nr:uncharacterized protein COCMIDRAFT_8904 [Bipolaris oryzae ATCC 44560]EUC41371.1 hypothetical protein COCMIDRAFT_8904 [Bipolaris oryzae ATCC 44560]
MAQRLLDQDTVVTIHPYRANPFYQATRWGNKRMLNMLLERGPDIYELDLRGTAPLHLAVRNGYAESVQLLLNLGANANLMGGQFRYNKVPPHFVPGIGGKQTIQLLVGKGTDLEARDHDGKTPLYISCQSGAIENVRLLLEIGADTWVKDDCGGTLLHAAAYSGSEALMRRFLGEGLDFKAKDNAGETVFHSFAGWRPRAVAIPIIELLISLRRDINEKTSDDSTALMEGVRSQNPKMVQFLVEHGADLYARDTLGRTPLHWATSYCDSNDTTSGFAETIRVLIKTGVNVNA